MTRRLSSAFLFILFATCLTQAQDRHFTQYFAAPQLLNPANIGFLPGKYRASLIHRDQWRGILDKAYTTSSANFDLELKSPTSVGTKDKIGIGLSFLNDHIGLIDLNTNVMALGLAYHKFLSKKGNHYLRAGAQFSLNQRNLNFANLYFSDQFNGASAYSFSTLETLPANINSYGNIHLGLLYTADWTPYVGINLGVAVHNINTPDITFFDPNTGDSTLAEIYQRYSVQLSMRFDAGDKLDLIPRVLYNVQGPYTRLNAGLNLRIPVSADGNYALQIGGWARLAGADNPLELESTIAIIALELKSFNLGFSYDLDMKETSGSNPGHNAFEISAAYIGLFEEDFVFCPQF